MGEINNSLAELTLPQKLILMEALWDELAKSESELESPDWHESILKDREKALAAGKATISDWEEAKERIRRRWKSVNEASFLFPVKCNDLCDILRNKYRIRNETMTQSTITDKGQTTVPVQVRKAMNLKPHQKVQWEIQPDGSAVVRPQISALELFGSLKSDVPFPGIHEEK
ncbi:MAG: hypothetical protein C4527_28900 [Candidatus Omnitrophota bacterium]|jgi:putative addiction module component (TIGR02574 family)|nr:MAG: hypothetical protein C4527_28900 [Candidatus Omnitrophota bacterium]